MRGCLLICMGAGGVVSALAHSLGDARTTARIGLPLEVTVPARWTERDRAALIAQALSASPEERVARAERLTRAEAELSRAREESEQLRSQVAMAQQASGADRRGDWLPWLGGLLGVVATSALLLWRGRGTRGGMRGASLARSGPTSARPYPAAAAAAPGMDFEQSAHAVPELQLVDEESAFRRSAAIALRTEAPAPPPTAATQFTLLHAATKRGKASVAAGEGLEVQAHGIGFWSDLPFPHDARDSSWIGFDVDLAALEQSAAVARSHPAGPRSGFHSLTGS